MNAQTRALEMPERLRRELGEALAAHAETLAPAPEVASPNRHRARRLIPAATALVALGAATIALLALSSGGGLRPQPASAAIVLRASAQALERSGPATPLVAGEYLYTEERLWTRYADLAPHFQFIATSIAQQWIAADGSGRAHEKVLGAARLTASGLRTMRRRGLPWIHSSDGKLTSSPRPFSLINVFPPVALSYAELLRLPTDPSRLSARIDAVVRALHHPLFEGMVRSSSVQARAAARFLVVRSLAQAPAPPRLLAAAYRVLALTPGLRLAGRVVDGLGRQGTGIAIQIGALELGMVVNATTGALLETHRTILYRSPQFPNWPPGLLNRATFVSRAVVRSLSTP